MKTYMFPGQGSQARGMGGKLFDEFPELTEKADTVLGYSIKELCLEDPRGELSKTQFTQPALYVVNALSYYARLRDTGETPDFVAGHSLGEFNALLAAECFDFETGLKLVKKRGELMSQATGGAMAAIINASRDRIEELLKENGLGNVDIANYNTPQQIVISGPTDDIAACQKVFQYDNVMYIPLNTSGAFHSRLMIPAQQKFETFLKKRKFAKPKIPVIANFTAKPYPDRAVVEYLSKQIRSTVLWSDTIDHLMSVSNEMEFVEIGHGDVLTKMILKIRQIAAKAAKAQAQAQAQAQVQADAEAETKAQAQDKAEAQNKTGTMKKAEPAAAVGQDKGAALASEAPRASALPASSGTPAPAVSVDRFALAEKKVSAWNQRHPAGTKVRSLVPDYGDLTTSTSAVVLFGHRAAVYMEGYNGYFDLDEIEAA